MAFSVLKGGMDMASSQVDQNFNRWINIGNLKHYFNVTNSYVVGKLILVLWPWRHRPWTRQQRLSDGAHGQDGYYLPPRDDINSPDMYIPLMALITYILLSTLLAGLRSAFHPELFGTMATKAIVSVAAEILLLKAAMYLWLNISSQSQLLDLIAYSGYKFVGVIVTLVVSEIWNRGGGTGGLVGWLIFLYTFSAVGFFLVSLTIEFIVEVNDYRLTFLKLRSLKYVLLPDNSPNPNSSASYTATRANRSSRTKFLFIYAFPVQLLIMLFLTWQDHSGIPIGRPGK
jgi:hypothetical protein